MEDNTNLLEILEELEKDMLSSDIVQDNKINFYFDGEIHRVIMPTQKDILFANQTKNAKYIELLKMPNTMTVKQLTKLLKEKDIDIDKMNEKSNELEAEMKDVYLSLAKKKDNEEKAISDLKIKLENIRKERMSVVLEKAELLAPAIENQVNDFYYQCLTSACTERFEETENEKKEKIGVWKKVWNSFEDYQLLKTKLSYVAIGKLTELIYTI